MWNSAATTQRNAELLRVIVTVLALSIAFGMFTWENIQPEQIIVVSGTGQRFEVIRQGPGWPLAAYKNHAWGVEAGQILTDQFPEGNRQMRGDIWFINAPVGVLLGSALLLNLWPIAKRITAAERRTPGLPPRAGDEPRAQHSGTRAG
jgi:hypothetical protein